MLTFFGSPKFFEAFITAKVLSYFPKRGRIKYALIALNGIQLVCAG